MDYGKEITHKSFFEGKLKTTKTEYIVPELIKDKSHALSVVMKGLEQITTKETDSITIEVKADPKTHQIRLITRTYIIKS
jgi:hypothetical protein